MDPKERNKQGGIRQGDRQGQAWTEVAGRRWRLQRVAVREGSLGRQHKLVACSWVWFGPHSVSMKFKIVAKMENQDILH